MRTRLDLFLKYEILKIMHLFKKIFWGLISIVLILFLAFLSIDIYFYPGKYNFFARSNCEKKNMKYVVPEKCSWFERPCRRQGYCVDAFSDGGYPCNTGNQCTSGICFVDKDTDQLIKILSQQKSTIGLGYSAYLVTIIKDPPSDLGHCRIDKSEGECGKININKDGIISIYSCPPE